MVRTVLSALFMPFEAWTNAAASSFMAFLQSTSARRYGFTEKLVIKVQ